jgi:hypothetical protein
LDENPLAEFVELPEEVLEGELWFSNVLCGVIRGALEMVSDPHSLQLTVHISKCSRFKCRYRPISYPTFFVVMKARKYESSS